MATTTLPERAIEPGTEAVQVPKHLLDELEQIVEHAEAEPELVHWYHFVPCAGGPVLRLPHHSIAGGAVSAAEGLVLLRNLGCLQ